MDTRRSMYAAKSSAGPGAGCVSLGMASGAALGTIEAGFHSLQRALREVLPAARGGADSAALELAPVAEPNRLAEGRPIEGQTLVRRTVPGSPTVAFAGFLDGTQLSRVLTYVGGVPIVHGTVAAVVRERSARRMRTWRHVAQHWVLAPRSFLDDRAWRLLESLGVGLVDTTDHGDDLSLHPGAMRDAAVKCVQRAREMAEISLAKAWVAARHEPLYVDGGISGAKRLHGPLASWAW